MTPGTGSSGPASTADTRARGAEAGASAYLVKQSFNPEDFLSLVAEQLGAAGGAA